MKEAGGRLSGEIVGSSRRNGLPGIKPYSYGGSKFDAKAPVRKGSNVRKGEQSPIEHGTVSGYAKHMRRKVPFLGDCGCQAAHRKYKREQRARARAAREAARR